MNNGDILHTKKDNEKLIIGLMKASGIACFIFAGVMLALVVVMHIDTVKVKYDEYLFILSDFETKVASLDNRWLILIVVWLLYVLRSLSPFYPYPVIFIITGMVFEPYAALAINFTGMAFNVAFRYYTGYKMGEGFWNRIIKKNEISARLFDIENRSNPLVLLAVRTVPGFPYNTVSNLYGSFRYPFFRYMLISMAVLMPKLISYSIIGNNVYDPMSSKFYAPLVVLMILSGISFFTVRKVLKHIFSRTNKTERIQTQ